MIVAVGANLPAADGAGTRQACERALLAIGGLAGVSALTRSRWFSTAPIPDCGQPRYINAAVSFRANGTPTTLLRRLQDIEAGAGRTRPAPNAARTLDLDIIDMGGLVRTHPDPILPHPRAHLRAFVLLPLRDLAPHWVHPLTGVGVQALLNRLPAQDIVVC